MSLLGHVSKIVSILLSKLSDCPNTGTLLCYPFLTVHAFQPHLNLPQDGTYVSKIVSILLSELSDCPNTDTSLCYPFLTQLHLNLPQDGTWDTEKVIDIPNKKVEGWVLPEMPGQLLFNSLVRHELP